MKVKIKVTQDDIRNGLKETASLCPIALAAKRSLAKIGSMDGVGITIIGFTANNGRQYNLDLPNEVTEFIRRFDGDEPVEPFEFQLEIEK